MYEGKKAVDFDLPDENNKIVRLKDFEGKWIVMYFYPKDNTPGCTLEAKEFTSLIDKFNKLNAVVLGISVDSVESHCKFIEKQRLRVKLLSDSKRKVCEAYGVWKKKKFYGKVFEGIERSTFLINPRGYIAKVWRKVKPKGHANEVLKTVEKLSKSKENI